MEVGNESTIIHKPADVHISATYTELLVNHPDLIVQQAPILIHRPKALLAPQRHQKQIVVEQPYHENQIRRKHRRPHLPSKRQRLRSETVKFPINTAVKLDEASKASVANKVPIVPIITKNDPKHPVFNIPILQNHLPIPAPKILDHKIPFHKIPLHHGIPVNHGVPSHEVLHQEIPRPEIPHPAIIHEIPPHNIPPHTIPTHEIPIPAPGIPISEIPIEDDSNTEASPPPTYSVELPDNHHSHHQLPASGDGAHPEDIPVDESEDDEFLRKLASKRPAWVHQGPIPEGEVIDFMENPENEYVVDESQLDPSKLYLKAVYDHKDEDEED